VFAFQYLTLEYPAILQVVDNAYCIAAWFSNGYGFFQPLYLLQYAMHSRNMNVSIAGSLVVICSPNVFLDANSNVTTSGFGCSSGTGYGAGKSGYESIGGGGGGYGGAGGCGFGSNGNEGLGYASDSSFSAGSGGGRYSTVVNSIFAEGLVENSTVIQNYVPNNSSVAQSGAGGGVIVFVGVESVVLNAYIDQQ